MAGYALFGAACLFQFLVGGLPAGALLPLMVVDVVRRGRVQDALLAAGVLAVFVAGVYVPMAAAGTVSSGALSGAEFVELYAHIRAPHHVLASSWPRHEYARFGSFFVGGVVCVVLSRAVSGWSKAVVLTVMGAAVGALGVGYLLIEVWPVGVAAKLQVARLTPFCQLMLLAVVAGQVACGAGGTVSGSWGVAVLLTTLVEYGGVLLGVLAVLGWCTSGGGGLVAAGGVVARLAVGCVARGLVGRGGGGVVQAAAACGSGSGGRGVFAGGWCGVFAVGDAAVCRG